MADPILRQWTMLRHVPRYPRKIAPQALADRLEEEGFPVSVRTVQRDLQSLSLQFGLDCDRRSTPYGWYWLADSQVKDIPALSPSAALTFKLAERFLSPLLPPSVMAHIRPHLDRAGQILDEHDQSPMATWPGRVHFLPHGMPLRPADVLPEVLEAVYDALLRGRRLKARYRPRDGDPRSYEIDPLGLVIRPRLLYLVCTLRDHAEIRQLALHRFEGTEPLDAPRTVPDGFCLAEYVDDGAFQWAIGTTGGPIRLTALFSTHAAHHLRETPLSEDQTEQEQGNDQVKVSATVIDSQRLRWWLLGFGDQVEVIEPAYLRQELADMTRRMAARYAAPPEVLGAA